MQLFRKALAQRFSWWKAVVGSDCHHAPQGRCSFFQAQTCFEAYFNCSFEDRHFDLEHRQPWVH